MTFSSQLGDHSVPAAMIRPEHGFFTRNVATTSLEFGSIRKTKSVGLLLTQTWSSPIASQSGFPLMAYSASGMMFDIGCCTPGTPGFCCDCWACCAKSGTIETNFTSKTNRILFMFSLHALSVRERDCAKRQGEGSNAINRT